MAVMFKPNGTLDVSTSPSKLSEFDMRRCKNLRTDRTGIILTRDGHIKAHDNTRGTAINNLIQQDDSIYIFTDGEDDGVSGELDPTGIFIGEGVSETVPRSSLSVDATVLIHSDGPNGSQVFVDSSYPPKTIIQSTAQHDTSKAKFESSSIKCYTTSRGDYIGFQKDQSAFDLSSNNWTFSFWGWHDGFASGYDVFGFTNLSNGYYYLCQLNSSSRQCRFLIINTDASQAILTIDNGTQYQLGWHNFAFTRSGNTVYAFEDGILSDTADITGKTINYSTQRYFTIGRGFNSSTAYGGWVDEYLFINGEALWTDDYELQTGPWTL